MNASLQHLRGRLAVVETAVRAAVAGRRAGDPAPDDPFRGLYLSDDDVDRVLDAPRPAPAEPATALLAEVERHADAAEATGAELRLRRLARSFSLKDADVDALLIALAPDLDPRFERLYGYLHDDVTRRRASIGLALELTGHAADSAAARARFASGTLVTAGLVDVTEVDRPFLSRCLQVPDRVVAHLLGGDDVDAALVELVVDPGDGPVRNAPALARALATGRLAHLQERPGAAAAPLAVAALAALGWRAVVLDLARVEPSADAVAVAAAAIREARLRDAGLVVRGVDALVERRAALRMLTAAAVPVLLISAGRWDPTWCDAVPVLVDVDPATPQERRALWRAHLDGDLRADVDPAAETLHFLLTPDQIRRAATAARHVALLAGEPLTGAQLRAGARAQNAAGLESRARRVEPAVGWDDLVLPAACTAGLRELADRARHRQQVIDGWGMRPGGGRGRGITALFAGDSGTGKTMSAEVIAGELGMDLYTVNLATVVDKYVGETEKNLERIFSEADGVNAVLLFDEADALFGRRSEVRDAHDRYANIEVAYLLQRMETFDGLAILATNLRANLDEAFTRRLDAVIDFPLPDEERRLKLWDRCLGPLMPRGDDLDLAFCAARFPLTGGNIRSITITAAYYAAVAGRSVGMADLMRATQREYRKLGRLCVAAEFGRWLDDVPAQ